MKRIPLRALVVLPAAGLVLLAAAACGGGGDDGHADEAMHMDGMMQDQPAGSIRVDLVNWAVNPAQASAKAGEITFWAVHDAGHSHGANEGGQLHDLQVMRKTADGGLELVGQVQGLKMGEAKALTLTLPAGDYVLACNYVEDVGGTVIGHYPKGMHAPFTVTG